MLHFISSVKVFLVSVTKDDQPVDFDLGRIKVSVQPPFIAQSGKYPIVKLTRLTRSEILKHTQDKLDAQQPIKISKKRERNNDVNSSDKTKSKKQQITNVTEKQYSEIGKTQEKPTIDVEHNLKRKNEIELSIERPLTRSKTQKFDKEQPKANEKTNSEINQVISKKSNTKAKVPKVSAKRKSDIEVDRMTRSKKQKIYELPMSEIVSMEDDNSEQLNLENKTQKQIPKGQYGNTLAKLEFDENEIVWGKLRGFPHWPAVVRRIVPSRYSKRYEVVWMNDNDRTSKLFRTQLFKFLPNFEQFSSNFGANTELEKAAKEGVIYLAAKCNQKH